MVVHSRVSFLPCTVIKEREVSQLYWHGGGEAVNGRDHCFPIRHVSYSSHIVRPTCSRVARKSPSVTGSTKRWRQSRWRAA